MASITGWTRLEPRPRSKNFDTALEARVRDATWMLARQWQVGEFQGDDAGTAVGAKLEMTVAPINRYRPGSAGTARPYDLAEVPLEALVEAEAVTATGRIDVRFAAEAGLYFVRLLGDRGLEERYRSQYLSAYPLSAPDELDAESRRLVTVMSGRAPDGLGLERDLRSTVDADPNHLPPIPAIDDDDAATVIGAAREWLAWWDELYLEPSGTESAWVPERFEYQFSVSAPSESGEIVLAADEYHSGHLDWHDFDVVADAALGGVAGPGAAETVEQVVIPTPVDFDGMPAPRWWEFEDGHVDFGRVDAAPEDLARLLMLEFALVYGNDWLVIPVRVDVGSLCQIRSLVVTDTFGQRVDVPASSQPSDGVASWTMFTLGHSGRTLKDRTSPDEQYFFLPPTVASGHEGQPLEEVLMIRDEMANMAWAIERKIQGPGGRPVDRYEQYQERLRAEPEPAAARTPIAAAARTPIAAAARTPIEGAEVVYDLASTVPDHWIPLVPIRIDDDGRSIALQRGAMLDPETGSGIVPLGRFLTPNERLILDEEEVPRVGVRATRSFQQTRWTNGASLLWTGRKKTAGRGEGSSGLRFDSIS